MKPNERYNVFNLIHKALRGMMYDIALTIQQTDFAGDEAACIIGRLDQLLALFNEHADHEDEYILPNVQRYDAGLVGTFEQDHIVDHRLTEALAGHINRWRRAAGKDARTAAGLCIFYAFNDFIAFNLYHMNREENELLSVLWKHFTDAEIGAMGQQITRSLQPEALRLGSIWILRTASTPELAAWLDGIRAHAPEEVFGGMMQLAQEELDDPRYDTLMLVLSGAPEPAR